MPLGIKLRANMCHEYSERKKNSDLENVTAPPSTYEQYHTQLLMKDI